MGISDTLVARLPASQLGGLLLYAASTLLASLSLICSKFLTGASSAESPMPVMQLVLVRSCVLVALTAPHARHAAARQLIADSPRLWLLRGVLGFASVAFIQTAVSILAMTDAVALALLSPLVVATLGTLLLRERAPRMLLLALPLATSGALLLVRPAFLYSLGGSRDMKSSVEVAGGLARAAVGVAAGLAHVFASAGAKLSVRRLAAGGTSAHAAAMIVLSAGVVSAVGAAALCALERAPLVWPSHTAGWALLAGVCGLSYCHQAAMTVAMQRVPATRAAPLAYLSAVWSLLADAYVFGHPPSPTSLVGGAAIVAGGLMVTVARTPSYGTSPRGSLLWSSGSLGSDGRKLVPLQVEANAGGTVLPLLSPLPQGSAVRWHKEAPGAAAPSLLKSVLGGVWVQARAVHGPAASPFISTPAHSRLVAVCCEKDMSAAVVNAAVRLA